MLVDDFSGFGQRGLKWGVADHDIETPRPSFGGRPSPRVEEGEWLPLVEQGEKIAFEKIGPLHGVELQLIPNDVWLQSITDSEREAECRQVHRTAMQLDSENGIPEHLLQRRDLGRLPAMLETPYVHQPLESPDQEDT